MRGRAAAPKGTKSCKTQGDFYLSVCLSVCPPQALSGLKSALSGLKSALSGLKSALSGLDSEGADFRPERANFRPERADSRPERTDFRPERADFRPERADFRPERAWGGTDRQTDGQMDRRTNKSSLCSTGLCPLWGRCPASHSNSQPCKAGQWVSLTTYCP